MRVNMVYVMSFQSLKFTLSDFMKILDIFVLFLYCLFGVEGVYSLMVPTCVSTVYYLYIGSMLSAMVLSVMSCFYLVNS